MTEQERRIARRLVDAARREQIRLADARHRAAQVGLDLYGDRTCAFCHESFTPRVHNQRYCNPLHADRAWRRSEGARESQRLVKQRQRARRRAKEHA